MAFKEGTTPEEAVMFNSLIDGLKDLQGGIYEGTISAQEAYQKAAEMIDSMAKPKKAEKAAKVEEPVEVPEAEYAEDYETGSARTTATKKK